MRGFCITDMKDDVFRKLKLRDWNETQAHSSWQIFKIMAEFVEGFEKLAKIGPCITMFGSARTKHVHKYYQLTVEIAQKLSEAFAEAEKKAVVPVAKVAAKPKAKTKAKRKG